MSRLGGTAKKRDIVGVLSPSTSMAPSAFGGEREVVIQRYLVGASGSGGGAAGVSSTSISSSPLSALDASARAAAAAAAAAAAPRFPRGRDCFFSKRLMVSACVARHV